MNTSITVQRSWLNANKDVAQRHIDSLVQATVQAKKDKAATIPVLKKYLKSDNERAMDVTYEFFVGSVLRPLPYLQPEQYADTIAIQGATNEKVKTYDLSKLIDSSCVKSAEDRGLDK